MNQLRILIFSLLFYLIGNEVLSQTTNWAWAVNSTGNGLPQIYGLANDQNQNTFMAGAYSNSLNFGPFSNSSNNVFSDGFLFKVDPSGFPAWGLFGGGSGADGFTDIAVGTSGDLFVAGIFGSPTMTLGSFTVTCPNYFQFFVMKVNAQGSVVWVKTSTSGSATNCKLASDNGGIYVTGVFADDGPLVIESTTLVSSGLEDIFVLKYDLNGNLLWATQGGGIGSDHSVSIDVSAGGDIFIGGDYNSSVLSFGSNTITGAPSNTNYCGFVAKFANSGQSDWVKKISPMNNIVFPGSLTADASGNCYLGGTFSGPGVVIGNHTLTTNGTNYFLAKYDVNGNVLWAINEGGNQYTLCKDLSMDNNGNVYISGNYKGSIVSIGSFSLTNDSSTQNIFIASYNGSGQIISAIQGGGKFHDELGSISIGPLGDIYAGGSFDKNTAFGTSTLATTPGQTAIFLIKAASLSVGIYESENDRFQFGLYPNPAQSDLMVRIPEVSLPMSFSIINLLGQVLIEGKFTRNVSELDVKRLEPGVYTLVISGLGNREALKFVKE